MRVEFTASNSEPDCIYLLDKRLFLSYRNRICIFERRDIKLTYHQFELLFVLASKAGRVFTHEQIMERVWGVENPTDTSKVDVTVRFIRKKLESDPHGETILKTKPGVGYYVSQRGDLSC